MGMVGDKVREYEMMMNTVHNSIYYLLYVYVTHTRFEGWNPRCGGKHASDVEAGLLIKTVNIPSTERGGWYLGLQAGASHG